ncbi:MAG: TetR/AcrR family transcriptional regulator [Terrimesophilobacter sp.]
MPESLEPALSGRRRGRPGYDQQSVLEIAVAAFNEFGYDATSMGMLASRLALSKSAIYHHFASKEELLQVALDVALTGLEEILTHEQAQSGPAADRLDFILRGAVDVLVTRQPYVTLLLRLHGNTVVERTALARRRAFSGAVADLLLAARDEGSVRSDIDPAVVARLLFGMINSIVEWYRPTGPENADKLADDVLTIALTGLRVPSVHLATRVSTS